MAQFDVGYFYETGRGGLPSDVNSAVWWYKKSAAQGQSAALNALARLGSVQKLKL